MNFKSHHYEKKQRANRLDLRKYNTAEHKVRVWNAFVDSQLSGVNDDDFSVLPRLLPESYFPVIKKTAKDITTFALRLLSLPANEIRAIVPRGPVRDFLIDELEVLRHQPRRLTGSFRFDMAVVGPPDENHPPQLLEINEIGFDGLARSSFFQKTLLSLMPDLKGRVISMDTAAAEVRNMMRLGPKIARVQPDCYNWDEEYLVQTAERMRAQIHLVSPAQLKCQIDDEFPLLKKVPFSFPNGRIKIGKDLNPDAVNLSFAFSLADYKKGQDLYARMVSSKTPQYGPFISGLVASKTILALLADPTLRRKLLGSSQKLDRAILPAFSLEGQADKVRAEYREHVLKHADGYGGEQVYFGADLLRKIAKIPKHEQHEWVVQKKTKLNLIEVNGLLSRRKKGISDLGVFVHYDWENGRYHNFEVGGLMSRATNKSYKVNVSGGGCQVAVLLERGA